MIARLLSIVVMLATVSSAVAASAASDEPKPLRGAPLTGSTGLRLLVAGVPPFLLDVDTGRTTPISGLDVRGHPVLTVLAVGKDAVVWLDRLVRATEAPSAEIYVVRRGETKATRLATAWEVAPTADGSAVWLKSYEDAQRCTLRQVALDGRERQTPKPIPCSTRLVDAGSGAVLIEGTTVLDPGTGRTLLETAQLWTIAQHFAVTTEGSRGRLALTDLRSGERWPLRYPSRIGGQGGIDQAAVRSQGPLAALSFSDPAYYLSAMQVTDVWLFDAATRRFSHLPDMPAAVSLKFTSMSWAGDGRLVILAETGQRNVVAVWRPGWKRIRVRPIRLPIRNSGSDAFVVWRG